MKKSLNLILPVLGGLFYASGFPMANEASFFLGSTIGLTLLFLSLSLFKNETNWKRDFLVIFLFSLAYSQLGYYWIPFTLKEFGHIYPPFNYLLSLPFGLIITPHYYLFVAACILLSKIKALHIRILSAAITLTILEQITPQQFPSHAGHPWMQLAPYLGLAPIFGAIIYSFLTFWIAATLSQIILQKRKIITPLFASLILILIGLLMPLSPTSQTDKINVRLVQANIGNNVKISSISGDMSSREFVYQTYNELSTMNKKVDLIIWPETAYPFLLSSETLGQSSANLPFLLRDIINNTGAAVFFGGYDIVPRGEDFYFEDQYNTTFFIDQSKNLSEYYHKRKLIPFGETLPLGFLKKPVSKFIQNISYFASGSRFPSFKIKNMRFISAICYEILFTHYIRSYLNSVEDEPNFLINVTNDSWYGETSEPFQHLFLAKWRAVEFQLPIVRMTNTGISSILYPDGSESSRIGTNIRESRDFELFAPIRKPTTYQRFGIFPLLLLFFVLAVLTIFVPKIPLLKDRAIE